MDSVCFPWDKKPKKSYTCTRCTAQIRRMQLTSSNIFLGLGAPADFFRRLTVVTPCCPMAAPVVSWLSATIALDGGWPPENRSLSKIRGTYILVIWESHSYLRMPAYSSRCREFDGMGNIVRNLVFPSFPSFENKCGSNIAKIQIGSISPQYTSVYMMFFLCIAVRVFIREDKVAKNWSFKGFLLEVGIAYIYCLSEPSVES